MKGKIIAVLLGTLFSLLLLVAVLLIIHPARPVPGDARLAFDSQLGWSPDYWSEEGGYNSDPNGLNSAPFETVGQRRESVVGVEDAVVLMGDSVFYGMGVEAEHVVGPLLEEALGGTRVLNLSVMGYSIDQYLRYLERHLPALDARVVVIGIFSGNDYDGSLRENFYGHAKPLYAVAWGRLYLTNPEVSPHGCVSWIANSLLYRLLWRYTDPQVNEAGKGERNSEDRMTRRSQVSGAIDWFCRARVLNDREGEEMIPLLLDEIAALVRRHDATPVFVLLPTLEDYPTDPNQTPRPHKTPYFRSVLSARGEPYLDFDQYLRNSDLFEPICREGGRLQDCPLSGLYQGDGGHYTPAGHRVLAQALADYLLDAGLVATAPESQPEALP